MNIIILNRIIFLSLFLIYLFTPEIAYVEQSKYSQIEVIKKFNGCVDYQVFLSDSGKKIRCLDEVPPFRGNAVLLEKRIEPDELVSGPAENVLFMTLCQDYINQILSKENYYKSLRPLRYLDWEWVIMYSHKIVESGSNYSYDVRLVDRQTQVACIFNDKNNKRHRVQENYWFLLSF